MTGPQSQIRRLRSGERRKNHLQEGRSGRKESRPLGEFRPLRSNDPMGLFNAGLSQAHQKMSHRSGGR